MPGHVLSGRQIIIEQVGKKPRGGHPRFGDSEDAGEDGVSSGGSRECQWSLVRFSAPPRYVSDLFYLGVTLCKQLRPQAAQPGVCSKSFLAGDKCIARNDTLLLTFRHDAWKQHVPRSLKLSRTKWACATMMDSLKHHISAMGSHGTQPPPYTSSYFKINMDRLEFFMRTLRYT